jgi:diacylglycerol kinase (ATP)
LTVKIILNPYSNRWRAKERWSEAEIFLKEYGIHYSLAISEGPGHIEQLTSDAVLEGFTTIIAAGGDGTIGEVVNGMMENSVPIRSLTLGVLPLGTANDLVYNLGLPLDLRRAVQIVAQGNTRMLDVCRANDRYFVNNSAIGLEPLVTTIQQKITRLKGIPRYLVAALKGIMESPVWQAEVTWDNGGSYSGPLTLLTVGNGARTGGLFFMSPNADPFDGYLTAVLAYRPTPMSILAILPKAMSPRGTYIHSSGVQEINTQNLTIQLRSVSPAHCDGELFAEPISLIQYSILPQSLPILVSQRI